MTSKSTPALLPLIFLQLVQRARDGAVSFGVYNIAATFFMIKELLVYSFFPLNSFIEGDNNSRSVPLFCWHSISGAWTYFTSLFIIKIFTALKSSQMLGFNVINCNSLVLAQGIQQCPNPALAKPLLFRWPRWRWTPILDNYKGKYSLGPCVRSPNAGIFVKPGCNRRLLLEDWEHFFLTLKLNPNFTINRWALEEHPKESEHPPMFR